MISRGENPHSSTAKKVVGISVWWPSLTDYRSKQVLTWPHLTHQRQTVRGGRKLAIYSVPTFMSNI